LSRCDDGRLASGFASARREVGMRLNDIAPRDHSALRMPASTRRLLILLTCLAPSCLSCSANADAQPIIPGINAPPLPPPPTPQIQVPPIPQFGVPSPPTPQTSLQNTFSDRVSQCNQIGGAAGLTGPDLDGYVRLCANQ
jgi:hypothetical protein